MTLDIRFPIGLLFSSIGVLLMVQGAVVGTSSVGTDAGLNVNLWWGLVMLIFGGGMLAFARRHASRIRRGAG